MRISMQTAYGILMLLCLFGLTGCGKGQPVDSAGGDAAVADAHDDHDHGELGPHDGHIIELGDEAYHAELTHDDANHRVGIYLLGSDAKTAAPIEAKSITINVRLDGQPAQYELPALPQAGETDGKSSYFELQSEPLHKVVAGESAPAAATARLSFTVGDKPYSGLIETEAHEHHHDH